jgi:hypothetical protein
MEDKERESKGVRKGFGNLPGIREFVRLDIWHTSFVGRMQPFHQLFPLLNQTRVMLHIPSQSVEQGYLCRCQGRTC